MQQKIKLSIISMLMAVIIVASVFTGAPAATATEQQGHYYIVNPYENVDWTTYGQYKAAHHTHSTYSDGSNYRSDMLKDQYSKNFDIVAMTDHDVTTSVWDTNPNPATGNWNNIGTNNLNSADLADLNAGTYDKNNPSPGMYSGDRTHNNGMISMGSSNEVTAQLGTDGAFGGHHINAFFASGLSGNVGAGKTMAQVLAAIQDHGGISHINHPGRYTGGQNNPAQSSNPVNVQRYVDLFMAYPSCVGIEIINKLDGESINDRILWDNILMKTMPSSRPVWGFSNDDSHSLSGNGHAWNVMLLPELTQTATRAAMETGAFYGVSRIDRQHGINTVNMPGAPAQTTTTATMYTGGNDNAVALRLLAQSPPPSISNIVVNGNTITITGADYDEIYWIADGVIIATGASVDVSAYESINSYVRAELVGNTGVAYTQPFGVMPVSSATPSVAVTQRNGNKNDLTISIVEKLPNGQTNTVSKTFNIDNNAADTYTVGSYRVYVDTKGNTQIRDCRIV